MTISGTMRTPRTTGKNTGNFEGKESDKGLFQNSANYSFVAEFADQKLAAFYVQHMRGKKRYDGKDIIIREVTLPEIDPAEGRVDGVLTVTGEALPVDEYEFS